MKHKLNLEDKNNLITRQANEIEKLRDVLRNPERLNTDKPDKTSDARTFSSSEFSKK